MIPRYGERVVAALNGSESLLRRLIEQDDKHRLLPEGDRRRLIELADECDFLAAQPLADLIGERGRRERIQ